MGTAYYMAPEQLQGAHEADGRADQYSVAVIIYELLTGEIPAGRVKSLHSIRKDVPKSMSKAIDRALSNNPDERFPSMDLFWKQAGSTGIPFGNNNFEIFKKIQLVDFKLEYGLIDGKVTLIDEITGGSFRLWPYASDNPNFDQENVLDELDPKGRLDKDNYRMGGDLSSVKTKFEAIADITAGFKDLP